MHQFASYFCQSILYLVFLIFSQIGALFHSVPHAFAPPRRQYALFVDLQDEAFGEHYVEEDFAHHIGVTGARSLQAAAESLNENKKDIVYITICKIMLIEKIF